MRVIFAPWKAWICLQLEIQSINANTSLETTIADLFSTGTKNGIKMPDVSEQGVLIGCHMLRLEKDIGNDNAVALCRNDGILLK